VTGARLAARAHAQALAAHRAGQPDLAGLFLSAGPADPPDADPFSPDRAPAAARPTPAAPVVLETIDCENFSGHQLDHRRTPDGWRCTICHPEPAP
jgi:hypothetical protein